MQLLAPFGYIQYHDVMWCEVMCVYYDIIMDFFLCQIPHHKMNPSENSQKILHEIYSL